MTVEEGEEVFGKRWNLWTPEERRQFVSVMDRSNMGNPLCLRLICEHMDSAPAEIKAEVVRLTLAHS